MIERFLRLLNKKFVFDMCTNSRMVFNPYSRKSLLVKCGKCPSCLQEKAFARANRIRNNVMDGNVCLFFTLTYSNDFLPVIDKRDIYESPGCDLSVYRSCTIRQVFNRHDHSLSWKKTDESVVIGTLPTIDLDFSDISKIPHAIGMFDTAVSVCWYPDLQNFFKRLRIYLKRNYNYEKSFSYFTCSEYGSHTNRAHFHGLLFCAREDEKLFRTAIVESWPFADKTRTSKFIEVARDASNYVASYVNCPARLFSLFQNDFIKPKHSHSKNFGTLLDCFSLRSILQKIESGDLFYYRKQKFDGESCVSPIPIPLYILHRYFPIFKGFSWLDSCQLRAILLDPQKVGDILTDVDLLLKFNCNDVSYDFSSNSFTDGPVLSYNVPVRWSCKLINPLYHFTPKETYRIYVRLENCYKRFHEETGLSRFDYAFYFERVYSLYSSMVLKCLHQDIELLDDYADFYDNAFEVLDNPFISPTLSNLNLTADPNKRKCVVAATDRNNSLFYRLDKTRKVVNYAMSSLGYNV